MSEIKDTSYIESFGELLKAKCHQDEPAFCTVACPFHLDIKELESKWEGGRWNAAYRMLQTSVVFPAIVSALCPRYCENACILAERGGSLKIGELERTTIRLAKRKSPNAFNLPPKGRKIAVIGGGLSGLGCALRLLNKKYEVEIYEKRAVLGGRAQDMMDPETFDEEIRAQFVHEKPVIHLDTEITDLEQIAGTADAVYIATGSDGSDFGVGRGSGAYASDRQGVFIGGGVTGSELMPSLADGMRAALAIERYLKTGLMNEPADTMDTKLVLDPRMIPESVPVCPADTDQGFTPEEAAQEAKRCRKCSCDICMRECDLMRIQQKTPGRLYEESYITVRPSTLANDGRWATRRIASCDQCGLCKTVCPQRIDMGEFLLQCHRGLIETEAMPWVFHDYWLRDMAFSAGEAALNRAPAGAHTVRYAFFPGCQMAASDPQYVKDCFSWLLVRQPDTAIWLNCCGAPAVWAAEDEMHERHLEEIRAQWREMGKPKVVYACPTCRKMFRKYLPEIEGVFIEELMDEWGLPENAAAADPGKMAIFDPCGSRDFPELQAAVRRIAAKLGISYEELSHTGNLARCCSYGGQYSIAAPDYAKRVKMERAEESPLPYITYCVNCRDTFASRGKANLHILDLAFGRTDVNREEPTVTERRENRLRLKAELLEKYWGEKMDSQQARPELIIDSGLERKLSDLYILISEMEDVIIYCEQEKSGVVDPVSGHITGHLKIGHMTYWAEYEPLPGGRFRLWNGYAHRMNLEGE
ncbi:MAG: NAD(P)-binding protein [Mogibacterium sp.]|nr:NAD(P)-binding protein [Mogibacterium sp.]